MGLFAVETNIQVNDSDHTVVQAAFDRIRKAARCSDEDPRLTAVSDWLNQVLEYNVPHGKRWRCLQVIQAFETLSPKPVSTEELEQAALLGWIVEIFQALYLIVDDIMDKSTTRRGRPCWYLVDEVGTMAINDAFLLETIIFRVLNRTFRNHPNYIEIIELLHETHYQTSRGQCLDILSERTQTFSEERYTSIVVYKTAYYTFVLPIRLGMYLANISDAHLHLKAEQLAIKIGTIFQAQDDFLDCYGNSNKMGKIGTDIVDAKCSWLLVKALQIASPEQREQIKNNIGRGKPGGQEEAAVKAIYDELNMKTVFHEHEQAAFEEISKDIAKLEATKELSTDIFKLTVNKIYKRQS